jgi:iron complex outermembrane receptor protein
MKRVFNDALTPRHMLRALFYAHCALPLLIINRPAVAEENNTSNTLPVISVTATQESELQQPVATGSRLPVTQKQTPASIDLITREQLQERGDTSVINAITRATGISSMGHPGNGGSALSARGFNDSSSVMQLYDGINQYGGVGQTFPFSTWSVDRIEVLHGPAAVIYGNGAIGGVVNIIPKKPTRGLIQHEVQATIGTDNTQRLGLGSGGAINDVLSYRVDLDGERSNGWVDMGDSRNMTFSGALRMDVTPDFHLQLNYAQGRQEPMRYFGIPLVNNQPWSALHNKNYNVADSKIVYNDRRTELSAEWTPNSTTTVRNRLYVIDSKRHYRNAEYATYNTTSGMIDRTDNTEIRHDQTQTGNMTDVAFAHSLFGLQANTSVGVEFNSSRLTHTNNRYLGTTTSVDPFNPVPGSFVSDFPTIPRYRNKAEQYAVFAENRLALTPRWSVLTGVRYDNTSVTREDLIANNTAFDSTFANTSWRIGTVYDITPDLTFYTQYAKAADPVSGILMLSPANASYQPATGKQIEAGIKQSFMNKQGELTLSVYEITKNNLLTRDPTNANNRLQVGQRSSRGIESTLSLAFARNWQLDANIALLRARYDDFREPGNGGTVSRAGNVPTDVPERLANAWVSWRYLPNWTASAGMRYVGKRYADNANTLAMPSYTTTDLALQWQATPKTRVALRGVNIFDKQYYTTAYYTATQWFSGPGRQVELTVHHQF